MLVDHYTPVPCQERVFFILFYVRNLSEVQEASFIEHHLYSNSVLLTSVYLMGRISSELLRYHAY